MNNINETVKENLCSGCGACKAVCPMKCIQDIKINGSYYPQVITDKCVSCGKCLEVCPGIKYHYTDTEKKQVTCFTAQCKDKNMLMNATSGGVVTACIAQLLKNEIYQKAFVVSGYETERMYRTSEVTKETSLEKSQKSRYVAVSQEKAIAYILEHPEEKVIYVGTSCAVHGLQNALRLRKRNKDNVLIIGLFCDRTLKYSFFDYAKKIGKVTKDIQNFYFRNKKTGGYPGNICLEFADGSHMELQAKERMLVKDYFQLPRCLYCLDKLNSEADISVGDNYTGKNKLSEGTSSVIVRTSKGRESWKAVEKEFLCFQAEYEDILKAQHLEKRKEQYINNKIYDKKTGKKVETGMPSDFYFFYKDRKEPEVCVIDRIKLFCRTRKIQLSEENAYVVRWAGRVEYFCKLLHSACLRILKLLRGK